MKFNFVYDEENDVLSIFNFEFKPNESVEISENIILDINKEGFVVGLQILDASEFFYNFDNRMDKKYLMNLENVELKDKEYRNNCFIILLMKSKGFEVIQPPMPLLRKSEYKSPLLCRE